MTRPNTHKKKRKKKKKKGKKKKSIHNITILVDQSCFIHVTPLGTIRIFFYLAVTFTIMDILFRSAGAFHSQSNLVSAENAGLSTGTQPGYRNTYYTYSETLKPFIHKEILIMAWKGGGFFPTFLKIYFYRLLFLIIIKI